MKEIISNAKIPIKIWASDLEQEAEKQVKNLSALPFIYKHIAVMADAHTGKGSTVGTVIATEGAIIPAAVGVDIGCGMCAVKLPFNINVLNGKVIKLRNALERSIPVGFAGHQKITDRIGKAFKKLGLTSDEYHNDKAAYQLGTLGGGNHFIEICCDENDEAWIMLHSGSRNIGKTLAERHIDKAKNLMKQYFIDLPDPDLAYFIQNTPEFKAYLHDLLWAQQYAKANRNEMMLRALKEISYILYGEEKASDELTVMRVDCHHNYTALENHFNKNIWITRKGAVSAQEGELGIIPGSMGTSSYIVKGKGNPDSFCSCSHGAGRRMSRASARKRFTKQDLINQTAGVECRKDLNVIDEIPAAYKDINEVMANQADLITPLYKLKQVVCIKG